MPGIVGQIWGITNMDKIDHELMEALIEVESSHNPRAFNPISNARGLTQITPIAWNDLTAHFPDRYGKLNYERAMFKPDIARQAGYDYLNIIRSYLRNSKMPQTLDNILAAYNFGIGNLKKFGLEGIPAETKNFITKIKTLLQPQKETIEQEYNRS